MTTELPQDLPAAKRRRLAIWTALRTVLAATVLVVLYYVLPLDRPWDPTRRYVCSSASWSS